MTRLKDGHIQKNCGPFELGLADLTHANLTNAGLDDANLFEADLIGALLTNANLNDVNLQFSDLTNASLANANFDDAIFLITIWIAIELSVESNAPMTPTATASKKLPPFLDYKARKR